MYDLGKKAALERNLESFFQFHHGVCENRSTYTVKTL